MLLGRRLQRAFPRIAGQRGGIDEMDAVWDIVALAGATAGIADEPHAAVGEVQRMGSMAEAPDGQLAAIQALRPDRHQGGALQSSVSSFRGLVAREYEAVGMGGRMRDDHDFTDRLIRGRLPHPPNKVRGLVLMPTRDAAYHGMPDQHP